MRKVFLGPSLMILSLPGYADAQAPNAAQASEVLKWTMRCWSSSTGTIANQKRATVLPSASGAAPFR